VKLRGGGNVEADDDPPRRLGLFELYGILLVSINHSKIKQWVETIDI
jgi:hypothetical protein